MRGQYLGGRPDDTPVDTYLNRVGARDAVKATAAQHLGD